jgi:Flp pilus assembly protein TadG
VKKTRWGDHGQSTVEFALILPLVVIVVLLIVQAGFVVRDQVLVSHAAREAARAAAVSDTDRFSAAVAAAKRAGELRSDQISVEVTMLEGGDTVRAEVSYRSVTDLAIIGALVPDIDLHATVVMRAESTGKHGLH